jgi:predicted esterase
VASDHGCLALAPTSVSSTWDVIAGGWGADVRQVERALDMLFERADIGPVAFAGFSDGASYALSLGLANGGLAEAVLAFSPGFEAAPQRVGRPRIWISHGTDDTVLPIDRCSRKLVRRLSSENYEVHYEEFGGGHVVPPWAVTDAFAWWLGA